MSAPEDELLEAGARRPVPRAVWVVAAVALLVAGVVTGVLGLARGDDPTPRPSTAPPDGGATTVLAVATDHALGLLYRVAGGRVDAVAPDGRVTARSEALPAPLLRTGLVLTVDEGSTVWVVPVGDAGLGQQVQAYTAGTLVRVGSAPLVVPVDSAAAAGGTLDVTGSNGHPTAVLGGSATDGVLLARGADASLLAADPARRRVLALSTAGPTPRVLALAVGSGRGAEVTAATGTGPAPSLLVAAGAIWTGDGGGGITRLSPTTLRPVLRVPDGKLGPHPVLVAAGDRSLFARPTTTDRVLACLDPRTGRVLGSWDNAPGPVAATRGRIVHVDPDGRLLTLPHRGCPG